MSGEFAHIPVMPRETLEALNVRPGGTYIDCTCGGGGHSELIARRIGTGGHLICADRDSEALAATEARLGSLPDMPRVTYIKCNYADIAQYTDGLRADGALADLGVSSHQIDTAERGFSYMKDAPLDMRMDRDSALTAEEIVNTYSRAELIDIFYKLGEERYAPQIATRICAVRAVEPITGTLQLASVISAAVPRSSEGGHPAKRCFQALRIEVNHELDAIEPMIGSLIAIMNPGGRLAIITFHSLEDRIVKQCFAGFEKGCTCPPSFPICVCGKKPILRSVYRKVVTPSEDELDNNIRAHSAKLRAAEKL